MPQVLIVDDDAGIREALRFALEDDGWTVAEAADGTCALELLRLAAGPMVVLLDQVMPALEGDALLRVVSDDAALARRHAYVLVTASAKTDQLAADVQAMSLPSVPIVRKPFDIDDLLATVSHAAAQIGIKRG